MKDNLYIRGWMTDGAFVRQCLIHQGSCPPLTSLHVLSYITSPQDLKKQSNQQIREVALTQSEAVQRLTEGAEKRETALKVGRWGRRKPGASPPFLRGLLGPRPAFLPTWNLKD